MKKKPARKEFVAFRIPMDLNDRVRAFAAAEGKTITRVVCEALVKHVGGKLRPGFFV